MVTDTTRWQDLEMQLSRSFSPAIAINRRDLFRGRSAPIRRVIDAVNQAGQHVVIYGERGVGKTSLANVLVDFLRSFSSERIASFRVNCNRDSTFGDLWKVFFRGLGQDVVGQFDRFTPNDVLEALPRDRKLILIVDEFDRVENPDIHVMFADTIKTLSDFAVDTTLVIVGVADDIDDLISEHQSIERNLVQVNLGRMSMDELREILKGGIEAVGMSISPEATTHACTISMGLPHYTHSLGLSAGRAAIDRQQISIEIRDVDGAVDMYLRDSQQTVSRQFATATYTPRRENTYFQVLLACALAPTDHLGFFRAVDIREPYSNIMGRRCEIPAFSRQLHDLCADSRGHVLHRTGETHRFQFRFTDPMIQPYLVMHGLRRGLIGLPQVTPPNV